MASTPAVAKVGPPVTVYTTDAPPPGGKAGFNPATQRLTVCDNEPDVFAAVARVRGKTFQRTVTVRRSCELVDFRLPPNTEVSLQVCLSQTATGSGPLVFCGAWKSTRT